MTQKVLKTRYDVCSLWSCCMFPSSEENPFDIDEKAMDMEEKGDGQKDEEKEDGIEEMQEDKTEQPGEQKDQEPKSEGEGEEGEKAEADEESAEKDEEEKEHRGQQAGKEEDMTVPHDKGDKPKVWIKTHYYLWIQMFSKHAFFHCYGLSSSQDEDEESGSKDEEQPEEGNRKEHSTDGLTGEENIQSEMAVELAGEASESDKTKEVRFFFPASGILH